MPVRLFVGNLPYDATEAELRDHFSAVGPVSYLSLPLDRETGRPRGFAFLEFNERAQAEEAIRRFHQQSFKGRPLAVSEARERDDRRPGPAQARPPARAPITRPTGYRPASAPAGDFDQPAASEEKPRRSFGPDSAPQRKRGKVKDESRSERGRKGPMREVVSSRFHSADDDEGDDYDDYDDENLADELDDDLSNEDFTHDAPEADQADRAEGTEGAEGEEKK